MSVTSEKHDEEQQQPLTEDRAYHSTMFWSTVALGLPWFLLLWLVGPVIFPCLLIRKWAASPIWDAKDRWTSVKGTAFLSLFCYLPAILFHQQLTSFWSHVPTLGEASIIPPTFDNMLFRWAMALPMVSLLAWIVEVISPKTVWHPRRVLLPVEQALVASTQPKDSKQTRRKATQQHAASNGSVDVANKKSSEQTSRPSTQSSQGVRVAEKTPVSQRGKASLEKNAIRGRYGSSCQISIPGNKRLHIKGEHNKSHRHRSHLKPSAQQADYNWDEGEGTLKL